MLGGRSITTSKAVFVASTGQHIGKTTTCLALVAAAEKLLGKGEIGFIKPVGQKHVVVDNGLKVDKDVVLFKHQFQLERCSYQDLSPVVIPAGYTRNFIDGKITEKDQIAAVEKSFKAISSKHKFTVVEGTGHCGVGSIINLNNARVASILGLSIVLVVNGGLGSAFDDLALNRLACQDNGVKLKGVIVNKIVPGKEEMIKDYFGRALARWDIPLLGVVPDGPYLSQPSMLDFEELFKSKLLAGEEDVLRHYDSITLISVRDNHLYMCDQTTNKRNAKQMDLRRFSKRLRTERHSKTLFVTHASRLDIVLAFISHARVHESIWKEPFQAGLILAGGGDIEDSEKAALVDVIRMQNRPVLFSMRSTYETMSLIGNYTAKLSAKDPKRTIHAIDHYVPHIDIARIIAE